MGSNSLPEASVHSRSIAIRRLELPLPHPHQRPSRTLPPAAALLLATAIAATAPALRSQTPQSQPTPPPPVAQASNQKPAQPKAKDAPAAPMTRQQAKELFASVDQITQFVSKDTHLPAQHTVKRRLISRTEVTSYLRQKFDEDKDTQRMERSELVLKKFGLLDRDFHLRPFLLELLTEQIAGFYDNKTKTVNLLDWIAPEGQKPVLAHELTHALQDQKVDLEKWSGEPPLGISKNVAEDNQRLGADELDTARSAVAEGQAMVVFLDYGLRDSGKTIADVPDLVNRLKSTDSSGGGDSPVLARAPLLLQQSLLFPYTDGLAFEAQVLLKAGRDTAFAGVLANPPNSSFEIMTPAAYLAHTPVPLLHLPDIHPLLDHAGYIPYDLGIMGELDVRILTELFGGQQMAEALTPNWDGGLYYAAQQKAAAAQQGAAANTSSLGLLYLSRWKNEDSATSFTEVYAAQLPRKYRTLHQRTEDEKDGEQIFSTEEGDVLLWRSGTLVFTAEGFPLPLARQLRDTITSAQGTGPLQTASLPLSATDLTKSCVISTGAKRSGETRFTNPQTLVSQPTHELTLSLTHNLQTLATLR